MGTKPTHSRRLAILVTGLVIGSFAAGEALGQATTVQLPTFNVVTTTTTVSVPDRGMTSLGGINRASSGRNEFGIPLSPFPNNRGIGSERQAMNMSVTATIHDLHAIDDEILSQANYVQLPPPELAIARRLATARDSSAGQAPAGIAAIRQQQAFERSAVERDALASYEKGLRAEAAGKPAVAKIHYQSSLRRATGDLKSAVEQRLALLGSTATVAGK